MENIEQLKQDNAKLTERLNNAAKFFREQKTQIEALTKENEELKEQINRTPQEEIVSSEKWNELAKENEELKKAVQVREIACKNAIEVTEEEVKKVTAARDEWIEKYHKIEKDIESKDLYIKELQNTYNEVFAEKEKITKQFKDQEKFESEVINTKVPELETKLKNSNAAYEELRKKYAELKELHDGDLTRYNELEDNYEGLQNKYNEVNEINNNLKKNYEELRESNKMLQDSSAELTNNIENVQAKYNKEHQLVNEYLKQIQELTDSINKSKEEAELLNQQLDDIKKDREAFRSQLVDAEKEHERLSKLYDTCEFEKLALQADNEKLSERIRYIEENNISDKEWQDHLENVIEQIRNLADDVINPKPASNENKENVMKRTGDYNVSGENIGV